MNAKDDDHDGRDDSPVAADAAAAAAAVAVAAAANDDVPPPSPPPASSAPYDDDDADADPEDGGAGDGEASIFHPTTIETDGGLLLLEAGGTTSTTTTTTTTTTKIDDEPLPSLDLVTAIADEVQRRRNAAAAAIVDRGRRRRGMFGKRRRFGRRRGGGEGGGSREDEEGGEEGEEGDDQPIGRGRRRPWDRVGGWRGWRSGGSSSRRRKEGYDNDLEGMMTMMDHPDFLELCADVGIDPLVHPGLLGDGRRRSSRSRRDGGGRWRRRYYRNVSPESVVRSDWFGCCVAASCLVIVATTVSTAITEGFARGGGGGDYDDGIRARNVTTTAKKKIEDGKWWERVDDGNGNGTGGGGGGTSLTPEEVERLSYALSDAYLPVWYDRTAGWAGNTYDEALEFCESHESFVPCPYEVYCPGGGSRLIFNEVMERSWAPIGGEENEWIQVGNVASRCMRYSEVFKRKADWGSSSAGNGEDMTGHIMCCLDHPLGDDFYDVPQSPPQKEEGEGVVEVMQPPPQSAVSGMKEDAKGPFLASTGSIGTTLTTIDKSIRDTYRPFWFDDADGWSGTTYDDGLRFCEGILNETFHLCPIKAVCPNGGGAEKPLYLQMDAFGGGEQWAPISNSFNSWVMVGKTSGLATCQTYLQSHHGDPSWGVDGSLPELKKHILCCQVESGYDTGTGDYSPPEVDGDSSQSQIDLESSGQPDVSDESVAKTDLHPTWYSAEVGGWSGGTHVDALRFCVGNDEQLCPMSEVCPLGRAHPPLEGAYFTDSDDSSAQWVPVIDKSNQWLLIKTSEDEKSRLCMDYKTLIGHEPAWGLDESEPGLKRHILCCTETRIQEIVGASAEAQNPVPQQTSAEEAAPSEVEDDAGPPEMIATWFDVENGWNAGSHDDAVHFCSTKEINHIKMELCPYSAYCPSGPGSPPNTGNEKIGLGEEIDQWAPTSDGDNHWVLVGMLEEDNLSTQCITHSQLDGSDPSWGLDGTNAKRKRHLMCCTPVK